MVRDLLGSYWRWAFGYNIESSMGRLWGPAF